MAITCGVHGRSMGWPVDGIPFMTFTDSLMGWPVPDTKLVNRETGKTVRTSEDEWRRYRNSPKYDPNWRLAE